MAIRSSSAATAAQNGQVPSAGASLRVDAPLIDLRGISKTFQSGKTSTTALSRVNLGIDPGEFVTVVGQSGCGKTTLLRIVSGLMEPSAGTALMGGTVISGPRPDIGIVFQQPQLLPWRTSLKNVLLPTELRKSAVDDPMSQAQEVLRLVGLEEFEKHYPSQLSGGMQQRVAIARALLMSPSLLLMDEPFGALDAMTREQLGLELQRICYGTTQAGKTVFFITHSISEAVFLGDRVVVMTPSPGKVAEIIKVPFERPRPIELMNSGGEFGEIVSHIRTLLSGGIARGNGA